MPIPSIVNGIKNSLDTRKKSKKSIDESVNLENVKESCLVTLQSSKQDGESVRLLDEGAITNDNGRVRLYIMKNVIENFYNSLSDDYVGYINLAHIDMWSLPLNLGTWTKKDLSIVDVGDGRKALNVKPNFNKDLHIVQDLMNQEIPLSISAELNTNIDWAKSFALGFICVNKIDILGFSVVGNPANVNSSNISLQIEGEKDMNIEELKNFLKGSTETDEKLEVEPVNEPTEPTVEPTTEEKVELSQGQVDVLDKFMKDFEAVKAENEALKAEIENMKSTKEAEKEEQLKTRTEDVLSKLEALMTSQTKVEEPQTVKTDFLGNFEVKKGE